MSQPNASARPSQVTVAGWTVAIASVMVVLAVWQTMSGLHSLDMRERLSEFITSGSGQGLGLHVEDLVEVVRWSLFVTGVAAVASAILGVYVLRRDRAARIGVTVAAIPIVLTSPVAGSLPGLIVGAGAAMLWTAPARDWFAGRAPRAQRPPEQPWPSRASGGAPGLDFPPPARPPVHPAEAPPAPPSWAPPAPPVVARPPQRVRIACQVTWALTGITGVAALVAIGWMLANQDRVVEWVSTSDAWRSSMDEDLIVSAMVTLAVMVLLWCAATAAFAAFAWRRQQWAWLLLVISAAAAAVLSLLTFPYSALHLPATALCLGLLLNREIRAWYAGPADRSR